MILNTTTYTLYTGDSLAHHNNEMFTTASRDNDAWGAANCYTAHLAPWWYGYCRDTVLTGAYGPFPDIPRGKGIMWVYDLGEEDYLKYVVMMVNPV
jgi:hypothetical protein